MQPPRGKQPGEIVFGILMLIFSLFVFWQAYRIAGFSALSSPGAFPLAAAALMVIAALVTVLRNRRLAASESDGAGAAAAFFRRITPPVVLVFLVIVVLFAAVLESLGFLLAAFVFLLVSIRFLHRRGPGRTVIISLGALISIYVIFRLVFKVVLPEGIVPEREIMAWIGDLLNNLRGSP